MLQFILGHNTIKCFIATFDPEQSVIRVVYKWLGLCQVMNVS